MSIFEALVNAQHAVWERLGTHLSEFIRKSDHRFRGEPWGEESDAWLRAIAALAGATQVITKTTHESVGIPTMEANAKGVRATRMAIKMVRGRKMPVDSDTKTEMEIIRKEACSIIDKTLELGDGDIAVGAVRGFQAGMIDVPWAPNMRVKGEVIPVRDAQGAVRYLEFGNLPFNKEIKEYHQEKLKEREKKEKKKLDYETAMFDITEISQAY